MNDDLLKLYSLVRNFINAAGYDVEGTKVTKRTRSQRKGIKNITYPPSFEQFWQVYPKRAGSNNKTSAFVAWSKHECIPDILAGVAKYKEFCEKTGKIGTEYVQMASTWLNQYGWENEWTLPKVDKRTLLPKNSNLWCAWAEKNGYSQPRMGESMDQYGDRLMREIR